MSIFLGRNQLPVFISFIVCGVLCGVFYDILKVKRRIIFKRYIFLFIDDLLFCDFGTVVLLFNAFAFNDGNLKWYEIPFMLLGFLLYRKTLSSVFTGLCFYIIDKTKQLLKFILLFIKRLLLAVMRPVLILVNNMYLMWYTEFKFRKLNLKTCS